MSTSASWSADDGLELTSPENVPETGLQVEVVTETSVTEEGQEQDVCMNDVLYCHCRRPWSKDFMIMCEHCQDWFHGTCVGINEHASMDIDKYHCSQCEHAVGKTLYKSLAQRQLSAGSEQFICQLQKRTFANADRIVRRETGKSLTLSCLFIWGFHVPILVEDKDGLDMQLPPSTITVKDIERFVGPSMEVEVIQVETQSTIPMTLRQFIEYFTDANRSGRLNLISLEVSDTALGQLIEPPKIARHLDWVHNTWPKDLNEELFQKPKVSKYCLIGSKNSYTDFHIDFGGTSVWYHVLWGEKVFYLVEPTSMNLALYEKWMSSSPKDKYEAFFADTVDYCYKLVLKAGQTLLIPTGWIHAVFTTEDSLVFGGNFLHYLNMDMQLRIYNMEKKMNIRRRYMFPSFELVHWLSAKSVADFLMWCNKRENYPGQLRRGVTTLIENLEKWSQNFRKFGGELLPPDINPAKIIKKLSHELSIANTKAMTMSQVPLTDRPLDSVPITAEVLTLPAPKPKLLSKPDGPKYRGVNALSSQDESSVPSPCGSGSSDQPPIKLKLKKSGKHRHQNDTWNTAEFHFSTDFPSFNGNGLSPGDSQDTSHVPSKDGSLKIRVSLSEARTEFIGSQPQSSLANLGSEGSHTDSDGDESAFVSTDKKKLKPHRSHHHRKKHRTHHHRKRHGRISSLKGGDGYDALDNDEQFGLSILDTNDDDSQDDSSRGLVMCDKSSEKRKHSKLKGTIQGEEMKKVHQDDEYIYPSLTQSDDDETSRFKKRGRFVQETDEAWCPGGRFGKTIPKVQQRPGRPSAKREAVEKGLSDAATTLASKDALKGKKKYKQTSRMSTSTNGSSSEVPKPKKQSVATSSTSIGQDGGGIAKKKKPPKGMATVKQRLSKILKFKGKY